MRGLSAKVGGVGGAGDKAKFVLEVAAFGVQGEAKPEGDGEAGRGGSRGSWARGS